jgi:hypothetical protein
VFWPRIGLALDRRREMLRVFGAWSRAVRTVRNMTVQYPLDAGRVATVEQCMIVVEANPPHSDTALTFALEAGASLTV